MRVRVGLHTGTPHLTGEGYVGADVHLAARIGAAGHGGQIVLSEATRHELGSGRELLDLGEHRLKDFDDPVQLFQLGVGRFPPLKTVSNTNLPRPASSFVGRARDAAAVAELIRGGARLLTLTGPGGSGKTRLAIEVAAELVPEFRAGVFWVELAALDDPELVPEEISRILGAREGLTRHIGERELLLVLDNFEQVVEAGPAIADLVSSCPNLHVVVTSRELLRLRDEIEYPVEPLPPDDASRLFADRSGLPADEAVIALCGALDNLPLAVELAAARTDVLSPAQILDRLGRRLDLFRGARDVHARQQTLRATIQWSHELLDDDEQRLFARLAVFAGGCTLDAAEAVAGAELDVLEALVQKSLVRHSGVSTREVRLPSCGAGTPSGSSHSSRRRNRTSTGRRRWSGWRASKRTSRTSATPRGSRISPPASSPLSGSSGRSAATSRRAGASWRRSSRAFPTRIPPSRWRSRRPRCSP